MPNGTLPNPLLAPLISLKQMGEQANVMAQSLGSNMARSASQGIDALIQGSPPLPGLPGGAPGGVGMQQLMPANLQQALGNIENVIIPPGMPRPSQVLSASPAAPSLPPPPNGRITPQPQATSRRRITELGGY